MGCKYYEIVIDGDERISRAYIKGFILGKGIKSGIYFCSEHDISSGHLKDLIHRFGTKRILCRAGLRATIISALQRAPEELGLRVTRDNPVKAVSFKFKFDTSNRKVAGRLKRLFNLLPRGLRLAEFDPDEEIHPEAKGVEGYAPMHEYRYRAKGLIEGDVEQAILFHSRLKKNEFVDVDEMHLSF